MRKQPNYTCMLKNLLKLYCIWTWDTLWGFVCVCVCVCVCVQFCSTLCIPFDETTTEQQLRHHLQGWRMRWTPKLLRLKLHCIWTWRVFFLFSFCFILFYIYIYNFFHLLIFYFYSHLYSFYFYFEFSLCLSNAISAYGWLVHCLSLFISLKHFLFVSLFFFSTWLFLLPSSFNFFAFHPLSLFHSKYH
jgi:hypothetical protein